MNKVSKLILLFALVLAGCNDNKVVIKGSFPDENSNEIIYLTRIEINQYIINDSARIRNNMFRFKTDISEPTFYQVGFSDNQFVTILISPGESVSLSFRDSVPNNNYEVSGSQGSLDVQNLDRTLYRTRMKLDSLLALYSETLTDPDSPNSVTAIEKEYENLIKTQRLNNIEYIINNPSSFASILALYQQYDDQSYILYGTHDLQYIKIVTDSLSKYYPKSKMVSSLSSNLSKEKQILLSRQLGEMMSSAPETTLDPVLPDINGKYTSLSSLKGKYVLLSFYSYTSDNCIEENLELIRYYNTFKDKGFEIYQINLDTDEAEWKAYVSYEQIPWISVREEDPTYLVNARLFNVQSLPANYLFDKEGKIIAANLHGRNLRIKLDQLFK